MSSDLRMVAREGDLPGQGESLTSAADVIIVGGGNAALCAAIGAREAGASVLVMERAPFEARGGNSAFTGGAFRVAYENTDELRTLLNDLAPEELERCEFGAYSAETFYNELAGLSQYRADADLLDRVVTDSLPTLQWLTRQGVRFVPSYGRQSFAVNGKRKFWGGLTIEVSGGGLGLMQGLYRKAEALGVQFLYGERARRLEREGQGWIVCSDSQAGARLSRATSVVLASGGFHANLEWRARYLGPGWDLAKVRGSRFNTGDGIRMALEVGAIPHGHWSGCHAVFYDLNAPPFGDINLLDQQKNYFTLGVVVNAHGERFVDEGADFRNYTYSGMGARVLREPSGVAWQVFDAKTTHLLPEEYRVRHATRITADSLEELASRMEGIDARGFLQTIAAFNAAVIDDAPFNPAVLDGRSTRGLAIPKSNWAQAIDTPPFVAYAVTCGITCTYGGVKVDADARVLDENDRPIAGLHAAGELVGGLYYVKYAGGAGLTSGSVLGRAAGKSAASG